MRESTVPDRSSLQAARDALTRAERDRRVLAQREAASRAALAHMARVYGREDEQLLSAKAELEAAVKNLQGAVAAEERARRALAEGLTVWLDDDVDAEFARLEGAVPIVMAPVRIETRFDTTGPDGPLLKVRVYPDAFVAEGHEPLLATGELAAGRDYWRAVWSGGGELQAWRELLRKTSAPRAAFILRATTPVNLAQRPDGEPEFPEIDPRDDAWRLDPQARLLPDRWLVLAYRGGKLLHRVPGGPVREPLALGFDPRQHAATPGDAPAGGGLELDEKVAWAVDFAEAEAAGMAVRIRLGADDVKSGFDRVLVLGVKGSLSPEGGAAGLARLVEDHHYDSGLSFLAQGTPTNNTDAARSGYPVPDPDGERSYAVERGPSLAVPQGDGARLMRGLGVPTELAAHIEGAERREEEGARAMNQALWPVTFGYFFEQILAPHVGPAAIERARRHFVDYVRGRGPFTAVRVRAQPYGIVPVTSLDRYAALSAEDPVDVQLPDLLRRLRGVWQAQVAQVPRVGKTADADADLLAVLAMDASARQVRVRTVNGPAYYANLFALLGAEATSWNAVQAALANPLMTLIGRPDWKPRLSQLVFADMAKRFRYPLVAPTPIPHGADLAGIFGFDFIRWIREATVDDLRDERLPAGAEAPRCLLYRMLRHSRLLEIARVAVDLQVVHGMAVPADRAELELVGIVDGTSDSPTVWHRLARPIPALTGTMALGDFVTSHSDAPETTALRDYDAALKELEGRSAADLDLLFGETLDESSHRFDAWVTSLATKRLFQLRERRPAGAYLGGFGWIENLRPAPAAAATNGGFIHAPSLQHATAAAVLRNGYLTRAGAEKLSCAVDLSSDRVRMALQMLEAMREGQPLGAILGEQVERGLHDRRVDWFIEPLRRRFPLAAGKSGDATLGAAGDAGAARMIVDGLALLKAWQAGAIALDAADFKHAGAPSSPPECAQAAAELTRLAAALDAVTDVLLSESVFQIVAGDAAAANASMDAMAKGVLPPEPAIAQQPRSGVPLTFRVGLVLGGEPGPPPDWPAAPTPRAAAEPWFDAWAGRLMGDPTAVRCRVTVQPVAAAGATIERTVTMADLRLRPSDVLALARREREGGAGPSELNARVAAAARELSPQPANVLAITYARDPGWPRETVRTFADLMTLAQAINALAGAARPLQPRDLCTPESVAGIDPATAMSAEANARATAARDALEALAVALGQALTARDAVAAAVLMERALAFGVGAPLSDGIGDNVLLDRGAVVAAELDSRRTAAAAAPDAVEVVKAVFGRDFVFLPRFLPPAPAELQQSLDAAGELVPAGSTSPEAWLRQASRARAPLDRWRRVTLLSDALGTAEGRLEIVQVPHRPGRRWVGLPFAAGAEPVPGTTSAVLHLCAGAPAPDQPWAGLLLDEWNEIVPSPTVRTGVAVHYDSPGAEPPQVVLIAVSPDASKAWSFTNLEAILNETLDLAKLRAVDLELLGALGPLAPTVYLAANAAGDTVSSPFTGAVITEAAALSRGQGEET